MEKDKSRGLKHVKNKEKYRGNSVKKIQYVPGKFTAALDSNWDRYNESIKEEMGTAAQYGTDFSTLAAASIGQGKHFRFKSDEALAEEVETENTRELFHLDLNKLHENILAIPFHERLSIPINIFSDQQILEMNTEAEEHSGRIEMKYKLMFNSVEVVEKKYLQEVDIHHSNDSETINQDLQKKTVDPDNDLEIWLDDILDG